MHRCGTEANVVVVVVTIVPVPVGIAIVSINNRRIVVIRPTLRIYPIHSAEPNRRMFFVISGAKTLLNSQDSSGNF